MVTKNFLLEKARQWNNGFKVLKQEKEHNWDNKNKENLCQPRILYPNGNIFQKQSKLGVPEGFS